MNASQHTGVLNIKHKHDINITTFMLYITALSDHTLTSTYVLYRVIEKDGRDLKPLQLKKYWTDLHVWRLKMFRKV